MKHDTILTTTIELSDNKKMYDKICKQLLSNKMILARIMKESIPEYKNLEAREIASTYIEGSPIISEVGVHSGELITGIKTESSSVNEGTIVYDIRFRAIAPKDNGIIEMLINVEAQNQYYLGYPIVTRGVYYSSRMISHQYGTEFDKVDYNKIIKVYSIWICRNVPKKLENSINSYDIAETNHFGHVIEPKEHYDLLSIVMVYLGEAEDKQTSDLINMLNILLSENLKAAEKLTALENDFQIPRTKEFENEVETMCNLSQGIEDRGIKKGLLQAIVNMVNHLQLSLEDAVSVAGVPEESYESYMTMAKEQLVPTPNHD